MSIVVRSIVFMCILYSMERGLSSSNRGNFSDFVRTTLVGRSLALVNKSDRTNVLLALVKCAREVDTKTSRKRVKSKHLVMDRSDVVLVIFHVCIIPYGEGFVKRFLKEFQQCFGWHKRPRGGLWQRRQEQELVHRGRSQRG